MFLGLGALTLELVILAFCAATLNGVVGYGFSSTVTPIALLWISNKLLNPALIVVELGVNSVLLFRERKYVRGTWPRARMAIVGLLPGVVLGTAAVAILAPSEAKVAVYCLLLPLIALQLIGLRRPIVNESKASPVVGAGIGFLYSLTTISGPPLALYWRNQGMTKDEFRATMAQVRVAESGFSVVFYALFGLFTPAAIGLVPTFVIPVILGVPLGVLLLRGVSGDAFRHLVMGADGLFVSYGLSAVLLQLKWIIGAENTALLLLLSAITVVLTIRSLNRLPSLRAAPGELTGPEITVSPAATAPPE